MRRWRLATSHETHLKVGFWLLLRYILNLPTTVTVSTPATHAAFNAEGLCTLPTMQRGGSDSCSPWWKRFEQVAQSQGQRGDGCSFRTLERIDCKVEYDPDTKQPNRNCQRILQKFRECPGRCDD